MGFAITLITLGLTIAALAICGAYAYSRFRAETGPSQNSLAGTEARVLNWHGSKGQVYAAGRQWAAFAPDPVPLRPGDKVLISKREDQTLKITPIEKDVEDIDLI